MTSEQIKADIKAANETAVDGGQDRNNGACICSVDWRVESGNLGRPRDGGGRDEGNLRAHCSCSRTHLGSESSTHATFSQSGGEESQSSHHVPKQRTKAEPNTIGHQGGVVSHTTSRDMFSSRPMTRACSRLCSVPIPPDSGKDNRIRQSNFKTNDTNSPRVEITFVSCLYFNYIIQY